MSKDLGQNQNLIWICVCVCVAARTGEVMADCGRLYEQQYAVALFNKVRFDIEGGGGPQPQLLHRKVKHPLPP